MVTTCWMRIKRRVISVLGRARESKTLGQGNLVKEEWFRITECKRIGRTGGGRRHYLLKELYNETLMNICHHLPPYPNMHVQIIIIHTTNNKVTYNVSFSLFVRSLSLNNTHKHIYYFLEEKETKMWKGKTNPATSCKLPDLSAREGKGKSNKAITPSKGRT